MSAVLEQLVAEELSGHDVLIEAEKRLKEGRAILDPILAAAKTDPVGLGPDGVLKVQKALTEHMRAATDLAQQLRMYEESGRKKAKRATYAQQIEGLLKGFGTWPPEARRVLVAGLLELDKPQEQRATMT